MITPDLKKLIDEANAKSKTDLTFTYADGNTARLQVFRGELSVTSANEQLVQSVGKLLFRVLQGDLSGLDSFK